MIVCPRNAPSAHRAPSGIFSLTHLFVKVALRACLALGHEIHGQHNYFGIAQVRMLRDQIFPIYHVLCELLITCNFFFSHRCMMYLKVVFKENRYFPRLNLCQWMNIRVEKTIKIILGTCAGRTLL